MIAGVWRPTCVSLWDRWLQRLVWSLVSYSTTASDYQYRSKQYRLSKIQGSHSKNWIIGISWRCHLIMSCVLRAAFSITPHASQKVLITQSCWWGTTSWIFRILPTGLLEILGAPLGEKGVIWSSKLLEGLAFVVYTLRLDFFLWWWKKTVSKNMWCLRYEVGFLFLLFFFFLPTLALKGFEVLHCEHNFTYFLILLSTAYVCASTYFFLQMTSITYHLCVQGQSSLLNFCFWGKPLCFGTQVTEHY